jgi:hypothetical protein
MNMHGQSVRSVWRSLEFKIRDRSDDVFHAAERFSNIFSDPTFRIYPVTTTIRLSRWPNEGSLANRFDLPGWRNPWTRSRRYGLLRLVLTTSERVEAEEMKPERAAPVMRRRIPRRRRLPLPPRAVATPRPLRVMANWRRDGVPTAHAPSMTPAATLRG